MNRTLDLDELILDEGSHDSPEEGMCVMEAVAYVAGEPFSDHPACASPVIGAFLRSWNDSLDLVTRQQLKPYIFRLVGTAARKKVEEQRAWLATDYLVRTYSPPFLALVPALAEHADALARLSPVHSRAAAIEAQPTITAARESAAAAWDAAWDAAGAAAGDAARAHAAAATGAAAGAAAWDAAWDVAAAAAWDAARAVAGAAAWAAAWDAARDALKPTVDALQPKAFQLLDDMLAVTG